LAVESILLSAMLADSKVAVIDGSDETTQSVARFGTKVAHLLQTTVSRSLGHTTSSGHQSAPDILIELLKLIGGHNNACCWHVNGHANYEKLHPCPPSWN
jgi:hypothetical protein